ncbi:MAG TPA: hypothetical protein VGH98_19860 [Gemmatimonadaceae bacterium]|jgi:hypothetical protein
MRIILKKSPSIVTAVKGIMMNKTTAAVRPVIVLGDSAPCESTTANPVTKIANSMPAIRHRILASLPSPWSETSMRHLLLYRIPFLGFVLATTLAVASCGKFAQQADAQFGDQHFKTSIALVELYHVRHGAYPASLADLDFIGDWDKIALVNVRYERLSDGYALDVVRGWVGKPTISYPKEFWHGLGLKRTNVAMIPPPNGD